MKTHLRKRWIRHKLQWERGGSDDFALFILYMSTLGATEEPEETDLPEVPEGTDLPEGTDIPEAPKPGEEFESSEIWNRQKYETMKKANAV